MFSGNDWEEKQINSQRLPQTYRTPAQNKAKEDNSMDGSGTLEVPPLDKELRASNG